MLQHITTFDDDTRFAAGFRNICGLCPETGAMLKYSRGRSRSRRGSRYMLIVPTEPLSERGGYFENYTWDNDRRKFVRAFSDAEAIKKANTKLVKIAEVSS
jgi:hypothetical protein